VHDYLEEIADEHELRAMILSWRFTNLFLRRHLLCASMLAMPFPSLGRYKIGTIFMGLFY
jgi:hypothetical protein